MSEIRPISDPCVACEHLTKRYRRGPEEIVPLDDLTLHIAPASFVALMGPSGSGKTTLLNLIAGIDRPSDGTLHVCGTNLAVLGRAALARWRAKHVGYIFQLYHLLPILTALENVELPLLLTRLGRHERRARATAALELVGLADRAHHLPRQLSGGQEQRVAIARALVADPPLLVADEPTGDLDAAAANEILNLLGQCSSQLGKTIIMVTHDGRAAERANRVLHLDKGRLREGSV